MTPVLSMTRSEGSIELSASRTEQSSTTGPGESSSPVSDMAGLDSCFGCLDIKEVEEEGFRLVSIRTDSSNAPTLEQKGSRHNGITTSKYTIYTWIPKGTFEQFRRLANVYFLIISVMMRKCRKNCAPSFCSARPQPLRFPTSACFAD